MGCGHSHANLQFRTYVHVSAFETSSSHPVVKQEHALSLAGCSACSICKGRVVSFAVGKHGGRQDSPGYSHGPCLQFQLRHLRCKSRKPHGRGQPLLQLTICSQMLVVNTWFFSSFKGKNKESKIWFIQFT